MARALAPEAPAPPIAPRQPGPPGPSAVPPPPGPPGPSAAPVDPVPPGPSAVPPPPGPPGPSPAPVDPLAHPSGSALPDGFDWHRAEQDLGDVAPPMFVDGGPPDGGAPEPGPGDVDRSSVRLADVGGMAEVKQRLEAAFLAPLRNPELRRAYAKSLRGGLLLYGPPGCGKTFLARAVAGELGAAFVTVSLADVLDMYIGQSERNLHDFFDLARRSAPCVVFLDEVDAIGQKRTQLRHSAMRSTVNQLLHELDGVGAENEGVFILAATNAPWDVDPALRRPGRLDRTLLVLPPDAAAREEILRYHLRDRPVAGIDLRKLARATDGFSGADLAHLCDAAAEAALHRLGAQRRRAADRHGRPRRSAPRGAPVDWPVVRDGPQCRPVRQRGRPVRRPAGLHEEAPAGVDPGRGQGTSRRRARWRHTRHGGWPGRASWSSCAAGARPRTSSGR